jgi:hypothetical protein
MKPCGGGGGMKCPPPIADSAMPCRSPCMYAASGPCVGGPGGRSSPLLPGCPRGTTKVNDRKNVR